MIEILPDHRSLPLPLGCLVGCWAAVFCLCFAGLVAALYNLWISFTVWSALSSAVLLYLFVILLAGLLGGQRPARVLAGFLLVLGGREYLRYVERRQERILQAEIRVPRTPVKWTWLKVPVSAVAPAVRAEQGGGYTVQLRIAAARFDDCVGAGLTAAEADRVVQAIARWRR